MFRASILGAYPLERAMSLRTLVLGLLLASLTNLICLYSYF